MNRGKPGGCHCLLVRRWCGFIEAVAGVERLQISQLQWVEWRSLSLSISVLQLQPGGDEEVFCSLCSQSSLPWRQGPDPLGTSSLLDVNECLNSPCSQECANVYGSYQCYCRRGYQLSDVDGVTCEGEGTLSSVGSTPTLLRNSSISDSMVESLPGFPHLAKFPFAPREAGLAPGFPSERA